MVFQKRLADFHVKLRFSDILTWNFHVRGPFPGSTWKFHVKEALEDHNELGVFHVKKKGWLIMEFSC